MNGLENMVINAKSEILNLWENRQEPQVQQKVADLTLKALTITTAAIAILYAANVAVIGVAIGALLMYSTNSFEELSSYMETFKTTFDSIRECRAPAIQTALGAVVFLAGWTMPELAAGAIGLRVGMGLYEGV